MSNVKEDAAGIWRAFGSRDADQIRAVLTEDAAWYAPPRNATQVALGLSPDLLERREGIVKFLTQDFRRLFPQGASFEVISAHYDGNTAIYEQRMTGVTVNGRDYDLVYCWFFEMDGPRVRRIREYMDTLTGQRMIFGDEPARQIA